MPLSFFSPNLTKNSGVRGLFRLPLRRLTVPALAALALALISCSKNGVSSRVIEFCTPLSSTEGSAPQVASIIDPGSDPPPGSEAIDLLVGTEYPITTLDASTYAAVYSGDGPDSGDMVLKTLKLAVVDNRSTIPDPALAPVVGRAIFKNFRTVIMGVPPIGPGGATQQYKGILGGNLLRRYAVRLHYGADPECVLPWNPTARFPTVTFIQEYSDDNKDLASDGFAAWGFNLAGGGRMILKNDSFSFGSTRVTVSACVEPEPFSPEDIDPNAENINSIDILTSRIPVTGSDALLLVATGTLPLVLGERFFDGVRIQGSKREPPVEYPASSTTFNTLAGQIQAQSIELHRVALVGSVSDDRSPCRELALRRRIAWIRYWLPQEAWAEGEFRINKHGAPVAEYDSLRDPLNPTPPLETLVFQDTSKYLQGLRFETSEGTPNIDGLIGHVFLRHFETIIDYPGGRILFRCVDYTPPVGATCPSEQELGDTTCCEKSGRCYCPPDQPCCAYPWTRKP